MPVNSRHPEYVLMAPKWKYMRDVAGGQPTVHAAGEAYLPKLANEEDADYKARKARATFFNATWRTIEGLSGMLFRKPPQRKMSAKSIAMLFDVTKSGQDIDTFAQHAAREVLTVGRVGLMADYPAAAAGEVLTVAQAEARNLRPHTSMYVAEAIINWRFEWVNNRMQLTMVVLEEQSSKPKADDPYVSETETRWRVLEIIDGVYTQWVERKVGEEFVEVEGSRVVPLMAGKPMPYIPFQFIGVVDTSPTVNDPPLIDLAYVNVSHYQTTADLEHGAHKTALPQVVISGMPAKTLDAAGNPKPVVFYMGGGGAWTLPTGATADMLEYTGAGLSTLETRSDKKEAMMAVLGARMLEGQKKAQEAAETASIHRNGEQATLASQAATLSRGFRQVMDWFDQWNGAAPDSVEFKFNDEFFARLMTPEEMRETVAAWQNGALSEPEMFEAFQKGGRIRDDKEFEDHQTEITTNPPTLLAEAPEPEPADA